MDMWKSIILEQWHYIWDKIFWTGKSLWRTSCNTCVKCLIISCCPIKDLKTFPFWLPEGILTLLSVEFLNSILKRHAKECPTILALRNPKCYLKYLDIFTVRLFCLHSGLLVKSLKDLQVISRTLDGALYLTNKIIAWS